MKCLLWQGHAGNLYRLCQPSYKDQRNALLLDYLGKNVKGPFSKLDCHKGTLRNKASVFGRLVESLNLCLLFPSHS